MEASVVPRGEVFPPLLTELSPAFLSLQELKHHLRVNCSLLPVSSALLGLSSSVELFPTFISAVAAPVGRLVPHLDHCRSLLIGPVVAFHFVSVSYPFMIGFPWLHVKSDSVVYSSQH